ncbi:MAG TPA: flagellar basal body L-ring protein FlgH [Burkholderiaceae bacterium]
MKTVFAIAAAALSLSACAPTPSTIIREPLSARPNSAALQPGANGAIFQQASYRPLFEDRRARNIGDLITIVISERTSAGKSTGSSGSKSGSVEFKSPLPTRIGGSFDGSTGNKFEDKAQASSSNNFSGTIAVTVVDVLANGNLVVAGEKQIALDRGAEFVRFSGVVSPEMIGAGNQVTSTQVADARVEYRTNSQIDRAEVTTMLSRLFLSVLPL